METVNALGMARRGVFGCEHRASEEGRERLWLPALLMAAGRAPEMQEYWRGRAGRLPPFSQEGLCEVELDLIKRKVVLGDQASFETKLGGAAPSAYHVKVLTAPIAGLIELGRGRFAEALGPGSDSRQVYDLLEANLGFGEFRSVHLSLWLAAAFRLPLGEYPADALGPNPRELFRWARELGWTGVTMAKLTEGLANAFAERVSYVVRLPGGKRREVAGKIRRRDITVVFVEILLCKVVHGLKFCALGNGRWLRWRRGLTPP